MAHGVRIAISNRSTVLSRNRGRRGRASIGGSRTATTGVPRAKRFLELNRQLDHYLARPDRLHSTKPRAHARESLGIVGRIREHRLRLLPGLYTTVGTRAGYRDFRIRFHVRASSKAIVVDVPGPDRI